MDCSEPFAPLCVTSWSGAGALGAATWMAAGAACRAGIASGLMWWALSALVLQPASIKLANTRALFSLMSHPILPLETAVC